MRKTELYKREKYLKKIRRFYHEDDIIKVITGVRRCGKSSLMEMAADELRNQGIAEENILFLNLDSRENRKLRTSDALEKWIEDNTPQNGRMKYLFVDEIQNIPDFEEVLNGFRTDGGYSIFITGSNSYLLSGELITKLTGRYLEFELFPLSFDEYVRMKAFYNKPVDSNRAAELTNYITEGGFPRTVLLDDPVAKRTYVNGIIAEIFEKDIRRRVKIKDTKAFETVRHFLVNNYGATTSINALKNALEKSGTSVSRATLAKYIDALVDAKILYECDRFDMKSKKVLSGEKKYYLADLSFYFANNTDNRINYGPSLENILYVYTRSNDYEVSVGRIGSLECDFIVRSTEGSYSYIQVAYTIASSRETEDREYRALEKIPDNYPKYVMTTDYLLQKRNGIRHENLQEFMINERVFE